MADIFISYANQDRERAGRLAAALERCGWSVWWDRDIPTGQAFDETIERELEAARCVVVLWSEESVRSEWVKNEAAAAAERGALLPAMIDRVKLPLEFRRRQTADLVAWEGDFRHAGFAALRRDLAARVPPGAAAAQSARPPTTADPPARRPAQRGSALKWAAAAAVLMLLGAGGYFAYTGRDEAPSSAEAPDLAARAAGVYFGEVVSDARGASRSGVTVTVAKIGRSRVRIAADYPRLETVEVELQRVERTIQNAGGDTLLLLDLEKRPPRLSVTFRGEAAFQGSASRP
jgi:hypothetical protein